MPNIDKAFRTDKLSLNDDVAVVPLYVDPTVLPGYDAPEGSQGLSAFSPFDIYRKFGAAVTDWAVVGSGGGGSGSLSVLLKDGLTTCNAAIISGVLPVLLKDGLTTCNVNI